MFNVVEYTTDAQYKRVLQVNWNRPPGAFLDGYRVQYKLNDGPWQLVNSKLTDTLFELQNPEDGTYNFKIEALDRRGVQSNPLIGSYVLDSSNNITPPAHVRGILLDRPVEGPYDGFRFTVTDQTPVITQVWDSTGENWVDETNLVTEGSHIGVENGATVGMTPAEEAQLTSAENNILTLQTEVSTAQTDINDLVTTYGSTASAAASADAASTAEANTIAALSLTEDALTAAEQARDDAALHATTAQNEATASAGSAASALASEDASGINAQAAEVSSVEANAFRAGVQYNGTPNADFSAGPVLFWTHLYNKTPIEQAPSLKALWNETFQGDTGVMVNDLGVNIVFRTQSVPYSSDGHYKLRARVWASAATSSCRLYAVTHTHEDEGSGNVAGIPVLDINVSLQQGWNDLSYDYVTTFPLATLTSACIYLNDNATAGLTVAVSELWVEDVTATTEAANSASAAATSEANAAISETAAGQEAAAAQADRILAETARTTAQAASQTAVTASDTATSQAAIATSQAVLTAGYADDTFETSKRIKGRLDSVDDYRYSTDDLDLSVGDPPIGAVPVADPDFGPSVEIPVDGQTIRFRVPFTFSPGRVYRLTIPIRYIDDGNTGGSTRARLLARDYDLVTGVSLGYANLPFRTGTVYSDYMAPGEATTIVREVEADNYLADPTNGAIMFMWVSDDPARAGAKFRLGTVTWEDITESDTAASSAVAAAASAASASTDAASASSSESLAATYRDQAEDAKDEATAQATVAITQAANATADAALAQSYSSIAASVTSGHLNKNSSFVEFPDGTDLPPNWLVSSGGLRTKVSGIGSSPNALRIEAAAGADAGIRQDTFGGSLQPDHWYVVEAKATLNSGTLRGSGFLFWARRANNSISQNSAISFTGNDLNGVQIGDGAVGETYSYAYLIQVPSDVTGFSLYLLNHYAGFSAANNATANRNDISTLNDITWHHGGVRPATAAEIRDQTVLAPLEAEVTTQAAAIATLDATAASLQTTVASQGASITQNAGAISNIEGNAAFLEQIVAADGSNPAMMQMLAGKNGSAIGLVADRIALGNDVDGIIENVLVIEDGKAKINNALLRRAKVAPTDTSEIFHDIQLKPIILLGADGDTVQYQQGDSYGQNPDRIVPDISALPALAAGESYDAKAINITDTQYQCRVKKLTAGTTVDQVSNAGADKGSGTDPRWQTNKPTAADAFNDYYEFEFSGTIPKTSEEVIYEPEFQPPITYYTATYSGTFTLKGKNASGTWVTLGSVTVTAGRDSSSGPNAASVTYSRKITVQSNEDLGSGADHFGIQPSAGGAAVTAFTKVKYTTQTQSNEVAVAGSVPWLVYPPVPTI